MIKKSFTLRVLVISFLLLALPLLVDSFVFFQDSYSAAIEDAKRDLKILANMKAFSLITAEPVKQTLLKEIIYLLKLNEAIDDPDQQKLSHALAEIAHVAGEFQLYIMTHASKGHFKIIASSVPALVNTFFTSYRKLEAIMETGAGTFIRYIYSHDLQKYIPYLFVVRVIDSKKTGQPVGIIIVTSNIEEQLKQTITLGYGSKNMQFAILNTDGIVFAATDPKLRGQFFDPISTVRREEIKNSGQLGELNLPSEPLSIIPGNDPPYFEFIFNDQLQIAYRFFLPEVRISVLAYAAKEEFLGAAIRHFLLIYSIYGLIFIIGGGITYWLALWISRPLTQLTDVMGEVGRGNLGVRFSEEPLGFEINILGSIFNHTMDNLLDNIQRAEDERVKKETYQRELFIARQVQRSLLPLQLPVIQGAEVAGTYLPAVDVGGDFYGFFEKKNQSGEDVIFLGVADVAGRGISSCLYSLSARSLLRSYITLSDDIGEILSLANNAFIKDTAETGMFLTILAGIYHLESKIFDYYSCGHVPGMLRRGDGSIVMLEHSGMAMGLSEAKQKYRVDSIKLKSDDLIILYTDGLIEATNDKHQHFSEKRLKQILQTKIWKSAQEVVDSIAENLQEFTHAIPQEEEVIIVALKVS
jgi:phosphoserine phosphatase RsbU/P